ncbi:MAG: hypothetical protein JNM09_18185 [Blastocatellia bacterium]|nr:hypothetical protein [Blastocatellia bacterium]
MQQEKITESAPATSPARTALACLAAMVFPGLGHFVVGRWGRGLLLALSLTAMFVLGLVMNGHIFTPIAEVKLSYVYTVLNMGMGLPYFLCLATGFGFTPQDAMQTAEYGNTFLAVTGALNLLAAMDAFDIAIGRKQ